MANRRTNPSPHVLGTVTKSVFMCCELYVVNQSACAIRLRAHLAVPQPTLKLKNSSTRDELLGLVRVVLCHEMENFIVSRVLVGLVSEQFLGTDNDVIDP
ncbi:hypothetical protein BC938DRAFT_473065, partial [Jimgerdemannia flammicorona]